MIFHEIHQSTKIKIIQIRETETTRIIDHGTTPTVDHTTAITTMNSVITLGIETTTIQTDKKIIFCQRIEIIFLIQPHKVKITEVVHQNTKDKSVK